MAADIEIPTHFLCPISLQLIRDPVTISTGITFDRENIEKWLFTCKNNTCPITKQVLLLHDSDHILTPNHTLRRLIQSWCIVNASFGVEIIPTPKQPIDKTHIVNLINDAKNFPYSLLKCLRNLNSIALESERNRVCIEDAGGVSFLISTLFKNTNNDIVREEVVSILYHLKLKETNFKKIMIEDYNSFIESLVLMMKNGSYQTKVYSIVLIKSFFKVGNPLHLTSVKREFFVEIARVLNDLNSLNSSKTVLKLLVEICPWGRNRVKAVEGGVVTSLIDILLNHRVDKISCELTMMVLDQLCGCAEGRAEVLKHGAGIAIVSKMILRVSHVVSNRGVRIISSICRFTGNFRVLQEMLHVGVVEKLCLVLQVENSLKTKEKAKQILKLHSRVWRNSSCIPSHLLSYYPSS